ncbi:MAG TPA: 50S ribosomal protein L23 [Candidatus Magasanikbacteria bacterium]|nr:50S ribosomal protein L23 [Candidatus Magasanikbacteria bacterium]
MSLLKKFSKTTADTTEVKSAPKKARTTKKAEPKTAAVVGGKQTGAAFRVLIRPITSEKAAILESRRSYSFVVSSRATKDDIRRAVVQVYGVAPYKIRTSRVEGKSVRFGTFTGKRSSYKKAVVILKEGDSIRVHEGV